MTQKVFSLMDTETAVNDRDDSQQRQRRDLWPLDEVDPKKARFPCCIVWTPLPVISWLVPYIGHIGICREDGLVLDFAGSNFVSVDNFLYGPVARYLQLDREKCCFPPNVSLHTCHQGYQHAERGTTLSWDGALNSSMQRFDHCHLFVADCLNRLAYDGYVGWNIVSVAALILRRGQWVDGRAVFRSFFPLVSVLCLGILMASWPFLVGMALFSVFLMGWYLFVTYCAKNLIC